MGGVASADPADPTDIVSDAPAEVGYEPDTPPTLDVTVLTPLCDGDVPYLQYAVVPTGTPNTTVTITWENPSGADVVMADLPLSGRVLWPGAVVDASGKAADWPGWHQENGAWVEGDEFDWVRPAVDVEFKVNPEATVSVAYPPSSPQCATDPPGANPPGTTRLAAHSVEAEQLPRTGSDVARLAAIAVGLLALGATVVVLTRRRRA
ncbi:hypothetical protein GCM10007967_27410 [Xylanimonas ulmi]|uniref:LPXTG-motif cell wall-anchored protein n=2 Tax=Xylanimonas ulmi TaxID=228973 RepID=A0A4Q7M6A1_9MICO|nr:LPXTG-motif cell wall-anchored protein [Xylanibacterium ulmi]